MGVSVDSPSQKGSWRFFTRKKQADSACKNTKPLLAKELNIFHLLGIGVGSTIGAGVYVLIGTVAREHSGPALAISFLIAGLAAGLSAFCYAELACRCPSAGSAYHYSYILLGEGVAWLIGWGLLLEYTIGSAAVARGITPNLAPIFGGPDNLPFFLSRQHIPGIDIIVDPCAAILALLVTGLVCLGIKKSIVVQGIVTLVNVCALLFVIVAGGYIGFKSGWAGYELPTRYFPFGVDGMLAGSATVFFAYIGFEVVASTAEEVTNPQRDLPLGISCSLFICCGIYMLVSVVVVGLVPYYAIDPDTPISSAFAVHGMQWAAYIINAGACMALISGLMGGILPQPRILMAIARDGLLPPFFCDINKHTLVPVKGTLITGLAIAILAFSMEVSELAGMVSVGTLLAFTMVAISVLILRYIPPNKLLVTPSLQDLIVVIEVVNDDGSVSTSEDTKPLDVMRDFPIDHPLISNRLVIIGNYVNEGNRRRLVGLTIALICLGAFVLTFAASCLTFLSYYRYALCGVGGILFVSGFVFLSCIGQDEARHDFGYSGGFICPFVPLLPIACILVNFYLLVNLGLETWLRFSIWLVIGLVIYVFYGRSHSSLKDSIYVPASQVDQTYQTPRNFLA